MDTSFKPSNIEIVDGNKFFPTRDTVAIDKDIMNHPNSDVFYDKASEKIILVPHEHEIQGPMGDAKISHADRTIDQKLDDVATRMKGFGLNPYDQSNELTEKLKKSTQETLDEWKDKSEVMKSDLQEKATRATEQTADKVQEAAVKIQESAADFKKEVHDKGITEKLGEWQEKFSETVGGIASKIMDFGKKEGINDKVEEVVDKVKEEASDLGAKMSEKLLVPAEKDTFLTTMVDDNFMGTTWTDANSLLK